MPQLIGQLNAEEACAVVAKAVQSQQNELAGYDYMGALTMKRRARRRRQVHLAHRGRMNRAGRKLAKRARKAWLAESSARLRAAIYRRLLTSPGATFWDPEYGFPVAWGSP